MQPHRRLAALAPVLLLLGQESQRLQRGVDVRVVGAGVGQEPLVDQVERSARVGVFAAQSQVAGDHRVEAQLSLPLVEAAGDDNVAVFETDNPNITVLWFF